MSQATDASIAVKQEPSSDNVDPNEDCLPTQEATSNGTTNGHLHITNGIKLQPAPTSAPNLSNGLDTSLPSISLSINESAYSSANNKPRKKKRKSIPYSLVQPTFDPYLTPDFFQPVNDKADDDEELVQAIKRRLMEITPKPEELSSLGSFVNNVSIVLDKLKVPGTIDSCRIECIDHVGSYRMNTMLNGHCCADIVVTLKTLPIKAAISTLGNRMIEELQNIDSLTPFHVNYHEANGILELVRIYSEDKVHLHFATTRENLVRMSADSHLKKGTISRSLEAIRHARWCDQFVKPCTEVHNLIRVMKDVRVRFKDFKDLNPWMLTTMCHYAMTYTCDRQELPTWIAFKRIMQLLSAGTFLPYSSGITDPMVSNMPVHGRLAVQNQEELTSCAQTLLRVMNYKQGINFILGLKPVPENPNVLEMPSQWQGITVVPGASVFTGKPQKKALPI